MDRLSTEVLIIGAGAAGLRAAIACCKAGTEVLVVAKTPPGSGTATIISGGGFGFGRPGFLRTNTEPETQLNRLALTSARGPNYHILLLIRGLDQPSRVEPWQENRCQKRSKDYVDPTLDCRHESGRPG